MCVSVCVCVSVCACPHLNWVQCFLRADFVKLTFVFCCFFFCCFFLGVVQHGACSQLPAKLINCTFNGNPIGDIDHDCMFGRDINVSCKAPEGIFCSVRVLMCVFACVCVCLRVFACECVCLFVCLFVLPPPPPLPSSSSASASHFMACNPGNAVIQRHDSLQILLPA